MRASVWTVVMTALVSGCAPPESSPDQQDAPPSVVPPIEVLSPEEAADLLADSRGNITVVNFWATWCPPCVAEMPELAKFHETFGSQGVNLFSFSVDHPDTLNDRVRPFVAERQLPFAVRVLNAPSPETVDEAFNLEMGGAIPATAVYGKNGEVHSVWYEEIDFETLAETVGPLIDPTEIR